MSNDSPKFNQVLFQLFIPTLVVLFYSGQFVCLMLKKGWKRKIYCLTTLSALLNCSDETNRVALMLNLLYNHWKIFYLYQYFIGGRGAVQKSNFLVVNHLRPPPPFVFFLCFLLFFFLHLSIQFDCFLIQRTTLFII